MGYYTQRHVLTKPMSDEANRKEIERKIKKTAYIHTDKMAFHKVKNVFVNRSSEANVATELPSPHTNRIQNSMAKMVNISISEVRTTMCKRNVAATDTKCVYNSNGCICEDET